MFVASGILGSGTSSPPIKPPKTLLIVLFMSDNVATTLYETSVSYAAANEPTASRNACIRLHLSVSTGKLPGMNGGGSGRRPAQSEQGSNCASAASRYLVFAALLFMSVSSVTENSSSRSAIASRVVCSSVCCVLICSSNAENLPDRSLILSRQ